MERPNQVLAGTSVDSCLASDGGIDHREEGGGHLHDGHAAHERCGDEAGEVADHATTEGENRGVATESRGEQFVGKACPLHPRLAGLARGDDEHTGRGTADGSREAGGIQRRDDVVRDDREPPIADGCAQRDAARVEEAGADADSRAVQRDSVWRIGRSGHVSVRYQVTSPAPARMLATRASTNSRSESRFR